jgi:outer membrane protein
MRRILIATMFLLAQPALSQQHALTLDEAKQLALEHNPELDAGGQDVGIARSELTVARSGYLPSVSASVTGVGGKAYDDHGSAAASSLAPRIAAGGLNASSVLDRAAAGIALNQLITDFGRTGHLVNSARSTLLAEQDRYEDLRQRLLLRVTADYYRALEAQSTLEVAQKSYDERKLLFDQIDLLEKNKLKSGLDVGFAGVNLDQARLLILRAQDEVASALAELSSAIGLPSPPELAPQPEDSPTAAPEAALEPLLQQALARPELKGLREASAAAHLYAKAQRGLANPSLSLVGVAGTAPFGDARVPQNYLAGGVNLSIPIFEGGRLRAQYEEAACRARQAADALGAAELAVTRDVRVAWLRARAEYESIGVAQRLRTTAGQALELAESRYRLGLSSIVELNRAQLNDLDAQIAYVRARCDYRIASAQLAYQTGGEPMASPRT